MDGSTIILLALVLGYFVPYAVASHRKHPSHGGIFVLNLFLGWTVIGWLIALIWAASSVPTSNAKA